MNKKIRHEIIFAKAIDVSSITSSDIILKDGKTSQKVSIFTSTLTQNKKYKDDQPYIEQKLSLKDKFTTEFINALKFPQIIKLHLYDGTFFVWGTLENPVLAPDIDRQEDGAEIILKRQCIDFE